MPALLAITLAPLLVTAPLIAFYFSQLSLISIISNLLVLPWVEYLTILGFFTTVIGFIFLPAAQVLGGTLYLLVLLIDKTTVYLAALPEACLYIKAPSLIIISGYYLGLIALVEVLRKEGKIMTKKRLVFALVLILSVSVWDRAFSAPTLGKRQLTVTVIDVGQGDSILVEPPDGKKILIDGGGVDRGGESGGDPAIRESGDPGSDDPIGGKVVVPFLHRKGIDHLDLVILTHPHADHLGGLNKVLEEIKVDEVLDGGQVYASHTYQRFKELVAANQIKYQLARAGQVIDLAPDIKGYILNPSDPLLGDTNSDSIVLRLVYEDISFLFTGDLGKLGEERVLSSGAAL
ncbi:MAG TPA: ComEC/Rec2 family competence protein, partial [Candidatus Sulfotelmatobacter sp.]|nr:ComEC/Rec2 family competence protein [Candidatus Sulfotelmatobacter sp.]